MQLLIAWVVGKALDHYAIKFGDKAQEPSSTTRVRTPPPRTPPTARRPTVPASTGPSTVPWPQIVPSGLPPFPGSGWVPDEPPPPAVVSRANQLLGPLWRGGEGTFKVEQTAGRWIVYRASPTGADGSKKGVVAFRQSSHSAFLTPPGSTSEPELVTPPVVIPGPIVTASHRTSPAGTSLPTLRIGSRGNDVVILQRALRIQDDGIFGPGTDRAVRAFQASRGLGVDGVVGRDTWSALLGKAA